MKEFEYTPQASETPAPEIPPVKEVLPEVVQESPVSASPGELIGAASDFMAADLEYTILKGMVLSLDIAAALQGKKRRKQIRWNPTDEDAEGISPSLAQHQQEAKARLQQEIVVWERQKASAK